MRLSEYVGVRGGRSEHYIQGANLLFQQQKQCRYKITAF